MVSLKKKRKTNPQKILKQLKLKKTKKKQCTMVFMEFKKKKKNPFYVCIVIENRDWC